MRVTPSLMAFNRGLVSRLGLARVDLEQLRLAAEEQTNWMPRSLGSMMLRPGLKYLGPTKGHGRAISIPFVFEIDDQARLELTDAAMRIWLDDAPMRRPSVHTYIDNGDFATDLSGWTDADESGAVSAWSDGRLALTGTGFNLARRYRQVTVPSGEEALEHALRVEVARGPVVLKLGAAPGSDEILQATTLGPGTHSLEFTPGAGAFFIDLSHRGDYTALLENVSVEPVGETVLPTPFGEGDLDKIRWAQSRDVIFLACDGHRPRRIERRGRRSWSIVDYETADGPFRDENLSRVTLAPSALSGDVTLTASADLFRTGHVGALFRLTSAGQRVAETVTAENQATDAIRVTGVGETRKFVAQVGGPGSATVTLQRSVGVLGAWEDYKEVSGASTTIDDDLDNQIIFYRLIVKTGDYGGGGDVDISLTFANGSIDGIARVVAVSSSTQADAIVLKPFGGVEATEIWAESEWSDFRGWPTATGLFQGRLWWGGRGRLWASVSDAFASFDAGVEGEAGPIAKTISDGPADVVSWIAGAQRLTLGAIGGAMEARSSSLDEPLSPEACQLTRFLTSGVAPVAPVVLNDRTLFLERAGKDVMEVALAGAGVRQEVLRLTALTPELAGHGFRRLAAQHQPDARVHVLREDGVAAVFISDPLEQVRCWIEVETDGEIEDVCVLPDGEEDAVYYIVKRVVDGETRRYHERWAPESACRGGALNLQADSYLVYEGSPISQISGLEHLEGAEVVIWADGTARDAAVVSGGVVAVSGAPCSAAVVGLPYEARFRSAKLAYGARKGSALAVPKRINRIALVLADVHAGGLEFGPDFDTLDPLPVRPPFGPGDPDKVHRDYDFDGAQFPGRWDTDARLCLRAVAPKPCTVLGVAFDLETVER